MQVGNGDCVGQVFALRALAIKIPAVADARIAFAQWDPELFREVQHD